MVVCEGLWWSVGFCGGLWGFVVVCGGLLQKKPKSYDVEVCKRRVAESL